MHTQGRESLAHRLGSSSLFGRFLENGPVDVYGVARNTSWTTAASMLYLDNPIGTGFSYATSPPTGFSTTDAGIAQNLVAFFAAWFDKHAGERVRVPTWDYSQSPCTDMRHVPLIIASESYGGKVMRPCPVLLPFPSLVVLADGRRDG